MITLAHVFLGLFVAVVICLVVVMTSAMFDDIKREKENKEELDVFNDNNKQQEEKPQWKNKTKKVNRLLRR